MAMHQIEYCATASPSHMKDMVEKIQKGLAASKKGFAYLHIFSPCPTGWGYGSHMSITMARRAVESNLFPLWEMAEGKLTVNVKPAHPLPIADFVKSIGKFKALSDEAIAAIQRRTDQRFQLLLTLAGNE